MSVKKSLSRIEKLIAEQKYDDAWKACLLLIEKHPENPAVLLQYANLCYLQRLFLPAIESYQRAFFFGVKKSSVIKNYFNALVNVKRFAEAELEAKAMLQKDPHNTYWLNGLGVVLRRQNKLNAAEKILLQGIAKEDVESQLCKYNLGLLYLQKINPKKALEIFLDLIEKNLNNAQLHRVISNCYRLLLNFDQAISHLKTAQLLEPRNIQNYLNLAYVYLVFQETERAWQVALEIKSIFGDSYDLAILQGDCLTHFGRREEALRAFEKAGLMNPSNEKSFRKLGFLWTGFDREKADGYFRKALSLQPGNSDIAADIADNLNRSRYGNEAEHMENGYLLAARIVDNTEYLLPLALRLHGSLLRAVDFDRLDKLGDRQELMESSVNNLQVSFLHLQLPLVVTLEDRYQIMRYHRLWGEKVEKLAEKKPIQLPSSSPRKKIRIGIMSSDLRNHPIAYFVLPIFQYYDRERFEIYCYSYNTLPEDNVQQYIRTKVDVFRLEKKISVRDAAQLVANDNLDILFDLGGSTDMNKIEVMAYKPAPIQVSWLGYPHSSGLKTIDYIVVDPYLKPSDSKLLLEKPLILPETWITLSPEGFAEEPINPIIPLTRKGFFTFGTMNNPSKFTRKLFEVWAKILLQVPGSHFLFVRPEADMPSFRTKAIKEFEKHEISSDRIDFVGISAMHRAHYNDIDVSLDTFPQTGGTTTCESLWMGVPVITLVGPAFFERLSYSNLVNVGLSEMCAFTEEEYIQKAVELAHTPAKCQDLRINLRDRIRQSPLGQTKRFVENLQNLIEKVVNKELVI